MKWVPTIVIYHLAIACWVASQILVTQRKIRYFRRAPDGFKVLVAGFVGVLCLPWLSYIVIEIFLVALGLRKIDDDDDE